MSDYLYKPKNFKDDTKIKARLTNEKAYIIQQIRKAYDKKHCTEFLGVSKKAWLKYCKHVRVALYPKR